MAIEQGRKPNVPASPSDAEVAAAWTQLVERAERAVHARYESIRQGDGHLRIVRKADTKRR